MSLIDGRKIAEELNLNTSKGLASFESELKLGIIACAPNFETKSYLELKKKMAEGLGINFAENVLPDTASTEDVVKLVKLVADKSTGVIVQLPLPSHIDTSTVLAAIPPNKDVDAFGYHGEETEIFPPVVGAIDRISLLNQIEWRGKKVVIFGAGRLVGKPAEYYAKAKGSLVTVVTEETEPERMNEAVSEADIIILGVGKPNLLTASMVKSGVVVFDAGASEDGGVLVGDSSPEVADKARIFTPVPGGIGPVTIAILFSNLLKLGSRQ